MSEFDILSTGVQVTMKAATIAKLNTELKALPQAQPSLPAQAQPQQQASSWLNFRDDKPVEALDEIAIYERMPYVPAPDADDVVLAWWHQQRLVLPGLYQLACMYHCIPPTQANEERHLSSAGLVFTDLRQSMKPETLDQILLLKLNPHSFVLSK